MAKYKGVEINTSPSDGMVDEAERGLDWREEYGRGGTAVGVARARDIINGRDLSINTVKRMYSFFARHEVDKQAEGFSPGEEGYPSAGRIAWALWGGDPGFSWSKRIVKRLDSLDDRSMLELQNATEEKDMTDQQVDIEEVVEAATEVAEVIETTTEEDRAGTVEVSHRAMEMEAKTIDEDTRRVRIAISSEEPVSRSFGMEVLEHSEEAINLSFLASGRAPLLLDHDPEKQIGVIESVDLDSSARRLRATVRFGKGALAKEAFDDVMDGIRANISVGYAINKLERKDKDTYVAKSWMPMEASLVSIPADVTVGVGRSSEPSPKPVIKTDFKENPMSDQNFDIAAVEAEARKAAQRNAAQIVELGAKHGRSDLAQKAISEGRSIEEFRGELLDVIGSTRALEEKEIGMSKREVKRFSLLRAIHALANPTDRRAQEAAAFEFECSQAAAKAYGRTAQGILLPAEVLRNWKRDLNSSDEAALFTDDFRGGDFIDALRNASSVMQAGATMLSGLSGDVKIPKKTGVASTGWISSEGGAASESEMTVGSVSMTPKTLGAFTDITRQLMIQSSLDVEALVRDDLAQSIALAIDLGALAGSGSSGQPTGIKNTGGINVVDFGAAPDLIPTYAQVVELETKVREDNALGNGGAYISNATMYGALKSVEKAANTAQFVVEPGGTMNGYRTIVSNQVASGDLYFGDFSQLLVGMFGGIDIVVDPYTASTSGTVRVVALQSCDVAVRHATAFCIGNDGGS
jgi:HK97 family phage major capsid protein